KQAVPVLIDLLAVLPQTQAWQAEDVLCRVAGERAPPVPLGAGAAGRKQSRDAWAGWWRVHGDRIKLAKLDTAKPPPSYTLALPSPSSATRSSSKWTTGAAAASTRSKRAASSAGRSRDCNTRSTATCSPATESSLPSGAAPASLSAI